MSKVAVVYWSGTGNTETMAKAVFDSVKAKGGDVELFTSGEFSAAKANGFDKFALGCPSMGNEVLEESEFEPMYQEIKSSLKGKKVGLFGSYGWGDGEWIRNWEDDARSAGIDIITDPVIANYEPNEEVLEELKTMGELLAG